MQNMSRVQVTRVAIIYDTPMLIVEYLRHQSGDDFDCSPVGTTSKFYHKKIRLKQEYLNDKSTNAETIAKDLKQSFPEYLEADRISIDRLIWLVGNLISVRQSVEQGPAEQESNRNKSSSCSEKVEDKNNEHLIKNTRETTNAIGCEGEKEILEISTPPELHHYNSTKVTNSFLSSIGDLNKVSAEELNKAKEEMNIVFDLNRLQPGDEGYQYDKRVDFQEELSDSSWD